MGVPARIDPTPEQLAKRECNRRCIAANPKGWRQSGQVTHANAFAKKHGALGKLYVNQWREILALYGEICLACGIECEPTLDHVVPLTKGGTNAKDNIQPLCDTCNKTKANKTIDYRPKK